MEIHSLLSYSQPKLQNSGKSAPKKDKLKSMALGSRLNEVIKEAIVHIHTCRPQKIQEVIKRELKKIEQFDLKDIHYMEVVSHWILPKLYYFEEKCSEIRGISLNKLSKQKIVLIQKIKQGLRSFDKLRTFYDLIDTEELKQFTESFQQKTMIGEDGSSPPPHSSLSPFKQKRSEPQENSFDDRIEKKSSKERQRQPQLQAGQIVKKFGGASKDSEDEYQNERQPSLLRRPKSLRRSRDQRLLKRRK